MAKAENLIDRRYGKLIVVSRANNRGGKHAWNCICDCGNSTIVSSANLKKSNGTKSCGCLKGSEAKDIIGKKFGKLTVLSRAGNKGTVAAWHCVCECGNMTIVGGTHLRRGKTRSCGCLIGRKAYDLVGRVFGKITVLSHAGKDERGILWNCICECGNTKVYPSRSLLAGHTNSCGCLVGRKAYDLTGQVFGKLQVVRRANNIKTPHGTKARWNCVCDCGNRTTVRAGHLLDPNGTRSCGCQVGKPLEDLTGQTFGRLTVVSRANKRGIKARWRCVCVCGNEKIVAAPNLKNGSVSSCGCWQKESKTIHGMTGTKTYYIWAAIIQRCNNPQNKDFSYYGERGITVCDRWIKFENFYADMGECPENLSLERLDNNKGYSPENCKWISHKKQMRNTRGNHFIEFRGERRTIIEWSEVTGISHKTINRRLKRAWSIERALSTPARIEHQREDLLTIWRLMIQRCTDPSSPSFSDYGGRGIKVCDRWLVFENFCKDMDKRPKNSTLDRIDNDKGYSPENCRWATLKEQANNKRSNRYIVFNGEMRTLQNWRELTGIPRKVITNRLDNLGWDIERALSTPCKNSRIKVIWNDKEIPLRELSDITGIPYPKILKRLRRGWSVEEATCYT